MQLRASVSKVDWTARAVVALSSAWFLFTAAWGLFEIPASGHLGAGSAATIMATEPMLQYHTVYPSWAWYTGAPTKAQYICHHPFGTFYFSALFLWIFGQHDFVVHLPTVVLSAAIPPLLYGIAREHWGEPVGAVAAAAYVVIPIAVGFSGYTNLETITIFGALLFFWGHSRHMASGAPRHLVASLVGLAFACSGDWAGYLLVAPLLLWAFVRGCVLPLRWTPAFRLGPYVRWWGLSVGVAVGELVLWLGLFYYADQIAAWLSQGVARGGGAGVPLQAVLESRKNWIDFSFTPLAIFLGKVAAPVCLVRLVVLRRDEEIYALSLLFGAIVQYVVFKNGADIHIFGHTTSPPTTHSRSRSSFTRSWSSSAGPWRAWRRRGPGRSQAPSDWRSAYSRRSRWRTTVCCLFGCGAARAGDTTTTGISFRAPSTCTP